MCSACLSLGRDIHFGLSEHDLGPMGLNNDDRGGPAPNGKLSLTVEGAAGAIGRAIDMVKDHGIKRGMALPVSAPFHCPLMQPAAERNGGRRRDRAPRAEPGARAHFCSGRQVSVTWLYLRGCWRSTIPFPTGSGNAPPPRLH